MSDSEEEESGGSGDPLEVREVVTKLNFSWSNGTDFCCNFDFDSFWLQAFTAGSVSGVSVSSTPRWFTTAAITNSSFHDLMVCSLEESVRLGRVEEKADEVAAGEEGRCLVCRQQCVCCTLNNNDTKLSRTLGFVWLLWCNCLPKGVCFNRASIKKLRRRSRGTTSASVTFSCLAQKTDV